MDGVAQAGRTAAPPVCCARKALAGLCSSLCPQPKTRACDATVRVIVLIHSLVHTRSLYVYTHRCTYPNPYTQAPCRHTRGHVLSYAHVPMNTPAFPDIFKFPASTHTEITRVCRYTHVHRYTYILPCSRTGRTPTDVHTGPCILTRTHIHRYIQIYRDTHT